MGSRFTSIGGRNKGRVTSYNFGGSGGSATYNGENDRYNIPGGNIQDNLRMLADLQANYDALAGLGGADHLLATDPEDANEANWASLYNHEGGDESHPIRINHYTQNDHPEVDIASQEYHPETVLAQYQDGKWFRAQGGDDWGYDNHQEFFDFRYKVTEHVHEHRIALKLKLYFTNNLEIWEQFGNPDREEISFYQTVYLHTNGRNNSISLGTEEAIDEIMGNRNRFKNKVYNTWEKFEYTFNMPEYWILNDRENINDLNFVIQTSSNKDGDGFKGEVFIDDIKVEESYDFIPDCDVRKKKGPDEYGIADLTKYYDSTIEPEEYEDTTAPAEVQFYFYPRYNRNKPLVEHKPIIYNDFRNGMFYLYNVDWGDGSPKEFISEPELLGEHNAIYHTYESSRIFEVTGTMIRMKPNKQYEPTGIIHHKKFQLFININEELDEDFLYFGTEGFSFIPYRNTLPVIGGYNEQSNYFKTINSINI